MQRYLDPTNDVGFKKVFSDKNRLKDFLNCVLHLPVGKKIKKIDFVPTEEIPDLGQGKRTLFDLKCQDESGRYFLVEMQNQRLPGLLKRMQYYGAHAYTAQLKSGVDYTKLLPVVVITVLKNTLFPKNIGVISFHRILEEKTHDHYLEDLSYVFVELGKFKKTEKDLKSFEDEWLFFLKEAESILKAPAKLKDKLVQQAFEDMETANWSPEEYDAYIRARLLLEGEEATSRERFAKGEAKGRAEGIEEGIEKGKIETARNMISLKLKDSVIVKTTGLSLEAIKALRS